MMCLNKIWFILLLLTAISARGQGEGSVVVHSDPRLSLLVKRPHNSEPIASNITIRKTVNKPDISATPVSSKPVKKTAATLAANASAKSSTLKTANNAIAVNGVAAKSQPVTAASVSGGESAGNNALAAGPSNVKISSDDASTTGHAGGWSPPPHREPRVIYSGKGYRVQIYNGPDRNKAMEIKAEFMRAYPGMRTYLTYISPCFRVKVGNYRSRNEALGLLREVRSMYSSPCMIVPDIITISTF